jgi:hypothetical protein
MFTKILKIVWLLIPVLIDVLGQDQNERDG